MEKMPYVLIYINNKFEYWPYEEAQEYSLYDLSDSIVWLTYDELKKKELELCDKDKE